MLSLQQRLCCTPKVFQSQHNCGVLEQTPPDPATIIREWMREVLRDTGMTPPLWAKRAGVAASTVQRAIKDDYQFVVSSRTLAKLATVANRPPPEVRQVRELQIVPSFLGVRYRVQAGNWFEVDNESQVEIAPGQPVAPDPRYAEYPQWLELVVGESANRRIQDGEFAHVVDAIAMYYEPKHGDWVVVERSRAGGLLHERTIKQVEIDRDGVVRLCPRSTDPRWQTALCLTDGARDGEDVEVQIVGKVIGAYSSFT